MKTLILIYLLAKSASKAKLTHLDASLAFAIQLNAPGLCPDWLKMIAQQEKEGPLPEAFGLFLFGLHADLADWLKARRPAEEEK